MSDQKNYITKDDVLNATNMGKDIISYFFNDAFKGQSLTPQHFIYQEGDENTASTIPFKTDKGVWMLKGFGASPSVDVFTLIIEKIGNVTSFVEALQWAVGEFNITGAQSSKFNSAKIEFKPALKKQKDGQYFYDYKKKLTDFELKTLGQFVTQEVCDLYNFKAVKSFTQIKKYEKDHKQYEKYGDVTQQIITPSTDGYPIYVINPGSFQKIYQPLNKYKGYRFRYAPKGNKNTDHIFGLEQVENQLEDYRNNFDLEDGMKRGDVKLPYLIIGGGERDSLNIASCGYPVVWFNSETVTIGFKTFNLLKTLAKKVVLCGDIDATGVKEMYSKALKIVDMYILELPQWLKKYQYRGKPCKDVKDYFDILIKDQWKSIESAKFEFNKLIENALPARFWNEIKDKDGNFIKYVLNNEAAFRFLKYNGFYRIEEQDAKDDYTFVRLTDNKLRKLKPHHIANFPYDYLSEKAYPVPLLNTLIRSAQFSERRMSKLAFFEPNLKDSTEEYQLLFFKNNVWKINEKGTTVLKYTSPNLLAQVWDDKIIPQEPVYNSDPYFKITQGPILDIEILKTNNPFFNFLINISRVNWRICGNDPFLDKKDAINTLDPVANKEQMDQLTKEYQEYHKANRFNISEENLGAEYIQEQKEHLISKMYNIGYVMHTYKSPSKAWQVHVMDNKISDTGKSNGGSGKSLTFNVCLRSLKPATKFIDGKDLDPQKDSFVYDGVTKNTDLIIIDDLNPQYPLTKFFNRVTSDFAVNPKGISAYNLSYDESPKMVTISNYGSKEKGGSYLRRVKHFVASDYYHGEDDSCFKTEHQPTEDLGLELIKGFTPEHHSDFINFISQCLSFYLSCTLPVNAPKGNIVKRNALESMGDAFFNWAEIYFSNQDDGTVSIKLNKYLQKTLAFRNCKEVTEYSRLTPQTFKEKLEQWCKYKGYTLNPRVLLNGKKFIKQTYHSKTMEFYYVQTPGVTPLLWSVTHVYDENLDPTPTMGDTQQQKEKSYDELFNDANNLNPPEDDFPV